jgi:hypothetical protein
VSQRSEVHCCKARTAERRARDEADRRAKEARDEADRRASEADRRASEAFHALAQRYLFQLQEAVDSLRSRIANWAHYGGREYSEQEDPGYWEPTTIYAFGRALGAERILALEGVYVELDRLGRGLTPFRVTRAVQSAMGACSSIISWRSPRACLIEIQMASVL